MRGVGCDNSDVHFFAFLRVYLWERGWIVRQVWVTANKSDLITAAYMYPGTEAPIHDIVPNYVAKFDHSKPSNDLVDQLKIWLTMKDEIRPGLVVGYIGRVDTAGHKVCSLLSYRFHYTFLACSDPSLFPNQNSSSDHKNP